MNRLLNLQERELVEVELRRFFVHPSSLHFVPLVIMGVMIVLWPYLSSPFVAVFIVLFAGLEPQFNNILFRTPLELEAMSIFPVEWQQIVMAKNIAALLLSLLIFPIVGASVVYFSPTAITLEQFWEAISYLSTVLFPLFHIGNMRSVRHPRRRTGWQIDDLAGIVEFLISLGILSIPYLLFVKAIRFPPFCIVYFIGTAIFWWRYSIPNTAELIKARRISLCMTA